MRHVAGVLEDLVADGQLARVVERRVGGDQARLERGRGGDQLERRARRVAGGDGAVGERRAVLLVGQARCSRTAGPPWRTGWGRTTAREPSAEHLAVVDVHHRERALAGAAGERLLAGLAGRRGRATGAAGCPAWAALASEVAAAGCRARRRARGWRRCCRAGSWSYSSLEAGLADAVALSTPRVARIVEVLLADLADVAEQVGADLVVRVLAQEDRARPRRPRKFSSRSSMYITTSRGHVLLDGRRRERQLLELRRSRAARSRAGACSSSLPRRR